MNIAVLIKCIKKQNNKNEEAKSYFEINKNDMFSLENALMLKDKTNCKVFAVTVGASNVQPLVKKIYNFGVDEVVLISDVNIAGSDTYATSTVLKSFIIKKKIDVVFVGKESSDSSTAQVGPQLSAMLNYNLAANVSKVELADTNSCLICSFKDSGTLYSVKYNLPLLVISDININTLRIPKINDFLSAKNKSLTIMDLNKLSVSPQDCGSVGSLTKVISVNDIITENKPRLHLETAIGLSIYNEINRAKKENNIACKRKLKSLEDCSNKPQIMIIPDLNSEHAIKSFINVVSFFSTTSNISVLLFDEFSDLSQKLCEIGITCIYLSNIKRYSLDYLEIGKQVANFLRTTGYSFVLLVSSPFNRIIAPIVATYLKTGLTADCSEINLDSDGYMHMVRPTFGDSKKASIICHKTNPQMATIRPSCFISDNHVINKSKCKLETYNVERFEEYQKYTVLNKKEIKQLEWDKNVVLIAGGGLSKESVFKLKDISSKMNVDFGATRVVVDKGYIDHDYQVGQTGVSVTHNLCVLFGVSGAIEHTMGISKASKIISINTDTNCLMNKISDVFAISDANQIINEIGELVL